MRPANGHSLEGPVIAEIVCWNSLFKNKMELINFQLELKFATKKINSQTN